MNNKIIKLALCAVAALFIAESSFACTNVLVSKGASKDGSVMISYSADSHCLYGELYFTPAAFFKAGSMLDIVEWDSGKPLGWIPQVKKTYQTVGNMNAYGVMITETTYGGRSELYDPQGIMDYGSLIYITLQRAKTAREAIDIIVDLANTYGYASSGESLSIGDKNEAWIMEIIGKGSKVVNGKNVNQGIVWVTAKVPDGYICAHANQSRVNRINFKDHENWLYSKDVVSFAREMGYYEGTDEDFSFCDAYAPADFGAMRGCEARVWSAFNILGKGRIGDCAADDYLDFAMGKNPAHKMPLFIKPAEKVSLKEVADVMRDHYEGTPMDMTVDAGAGGHHLPYRWRPMDFEYEGHTYVNERAIATQQTGFWIVCQSRSWVPDELAGILWFGVDDAATSCLTPVYTSTASVPECVAVGNGNLLEYSPTSLFWITTRIANFAYLLYDRIAPEVQAVANKFENDRLAEIPVIDKTAIELLNSGEEDAREQAIAFITDYSNTQANNLFNTWKDLDIYLLTKYIDGNVKVQNPDGSFKNNGYSKAIPEYPEWPGYSDKWKETVVKDAAKTLLVK